LSSKETLELDGRSEECVELDGRSEERVELEKGKQELGRRMVIRESERTVRRLDKVKVRESDPKSSK